MTFALPALIGGFAFLYLWHFWGAEAVIVAASVLLALELYRDLRGYRRG